MIRTHAHATWWKLNARIFLVREKGYAKISRCTVLYAHMYRLTIHLCTHTHACTHPHTLTQTSTPITSFSAKFLRPSTPTTSYTSVWRCPWLPSQVTTQLLWITLISLSTIEPRLPGRNWTETSLIPVLRSYDSDPFHAGNCLLVQLECAWTGVLLLSNQMNYNNTMLEVIMVLQWIARGNIQQEAAFPRWYSISSFELMLFNLGEYTCIRVVL